MSTRDAIWREIQAAALAQRQAGETDAQAITRWLATPAGQAAAVRYRTAPAAAPEPPAPPLPDVRRGCEHAVLGWIRHAAGRLQAREPGLSDAQAFVRAVAFR